MFTEEQNKELIRRYLLEVWGQGSHATEDELVAEDYIDHNPFPGVPPGRAGHRISVDIIRSAFPDMTLDIQDLIAEGDKVVDRWVAQATHRGEFFGIPATGKQIRFSGIDINRIENGQITEIWHIEDNLGLMQQIAPMQQAG